MVKRNKLATAIKLAMLGAAGAAMLSTAPVFAQDDLSAIEEVIVTGSRIKRADLDSASPISVLDREDMKISGLTDIGDLLQSMPSMSGSPIGTTTNNGGNGEVQIDLRGMGVNRTLMLVNGRRTVDGGDYTTIPTAMIERVDILKDGASAVYGADAVAGVVNIMTRKDFEGVELDIQTADYFDMDSGKQNSVSLIVGQNFDKGNFVMGAEYVTQEAAYQSDAPWDFFQNTYYIYPQGCESNVTSCYAGGSSRIPEGRLKAADLNQRFNADGSARLFDWFNGQLNQKGGVANPDFDPAYGVNTFENPVYMNAGNGLTTFDGRNYNYAPVNYIQTPYERFNFFVEGSAQISKDVRFFTEIRANNRKSKQELAPMPYDSRAGFDPGYGGTWQVIDPTTGLPLREIAGVDADGDDVTYYTDDQALGSVVAPVAYNGISEDNYYNTTGAPIVDARRRMVETARTFTQEVTQVQAVFGFEGSFNDLDWQASYNRGYRSRTDNDGGQFFGANLANAMGPSADKNNDGTPECYSDVNDASTLIKGCVPINFFGGPGSLTEDMINYVAADLTDFTTTEQEVFDASISGSAFELPGGALGWAVGVGYLAQWQTYSPDSTKVFGAVTGGKGKGSEGSLYNNNLYMEFLAPVFDNGSQSLDLKGGLRYDDYSAFGSDTTWQLGLDFQLLDDLKLRSTAGTVFRSPTINDLYGGQLDNAPTATDPCSTTPLPVGCASASVQDDSQLPGTVGGNSGLTPETGDTFTAGLVYTPSFGDAGDLSFTLDYWKINIENGISSFGTQYILDQCYKGGDASFCDLVTRTNDYSIENVLDISQNVAEQAAAGIDTEVRYTIDTNMGQWKASFLWTHLLERSKVALPGADETRLEAGYTDPTAEDGGAYAENKINYSLSWYMNNLSVSYRGEYISALDTLTPLSFADYLDDPAYSQHIDAQLYHDLVATYDFDTTGTTVSAGITNLTNEEPPYIDIGFNAKTDPATYRMFGRGYYLRLTQSF